MLLMQMHYKLSLFQMLHTTGQQTMEELRQIASKKEPIVDEEGRTVYPEYYVGGELK